MRNADPSPTPTTKVPMPWRVSTSPPACSLEIASRTTVRLTPNSAIDRRLGGQLVARREPAVADALAERLDEAEGKRAWPPGGENILIQGTSGQTPNRRA